MKTLKFRILGFLLVIPVVLSGCSATLQSSWRDFNAYFNTYYNAKTSFERGVELQERQEYEINPERPIRVHEPPRRAGLSEFEEAVQKSADVIRFHPQSRWVDNAIEMIGMSYYYKQRYFSADQKFTELLHTTSDPELRQRAILWRGKAALELESYVEGINLMQSRLFSTEFEWDPEIEAEVQLVIAQLLVERENYEDAMGFIEDALPEIGSRKLEMRAHFLHGQLLELLERYDESFDAYKKATHRSNPNYDLIYHAELKLGMVARKRGDTEWAYDHFMSMSRDDRHFDYIAAIEYEIGRTYHVQDRFTSAREMYERVLRRQTQTPTSEVMAKCYYGMAEIYRDYFTDYTLTAAYFDSSAQQASNIERLPKDFDADLMSQSYGEYSRLQKEINHLDSLLWLGELSEDKFDSVITQIREQKIAEMEEQQREQRRQQMATAGGLEEVGEQADEHTENGFLNHKNPQLMQQHSQAFQAYWGTRPLVDDWRRMEEVRRNIVRQYEEEEEEIDDIDEAIEEAAEPQRQMVELDLSEIPFTADEQRETRRQIASHEYEIGNVFFTSLAMPDSAATYYRNVMRRFPDSELAPQAIYSLSELYQSAGDSVQALQYAMQLTDFYPGTIYAERMADRYMLDLEKPELTMSREDSISRAYYEIKNQPVSPDRASQLKKLAETYPESEEAPEALYRAILDFIEAAREEEKYAYRMNDLALSRMIWEQKKNEFRIFQDSVEALMADSLYMAEIDKMDQSVSEDSVDAGESMPEPDQGTDEETEHTEELKESEEADPGMREGTGEAAEVEEAAETTEVEEAEEAEEADQAAELEIPADPVDAEVPEDPEEAEETEISEAEEFRERDETGDSLEVESREEGNDDTEEAKEEEEYADEPASEEIQEQPVEKNMRTHLQEITQMTLDDPDFSELFPYEGALWDSARVALITMRNEYPDFPKSRVVNDLADELEVDRVRSLLVDTDKIYPCNELDERPGVEGGMDQFFVESGFQQIIDANQISGTVVVQLIIDQQGTPVEVHTDEEYDDEGFLQALIEAVEEHMRFSTPQFTGVEVKADCEITIEFDYEN